MYTNKIQGKFREWFRRYIFAEAIGTCLALGIASVVFAHSGSYIAAAGAGFAGEGIGFYGFFVVRELWANGRAYQTLPLLKRLWSIMAASSTNMIIEFAPAEIIDSIFVRPFLMYFMPQHVSPYALGFVAGKLSADALFYVFAITGYEIKKRLRSN